MAAQHQAHLISAYRGAGAHDEMCDPGGEVRPHWRYVAQALAGLEPAALEQRLGEARRLLRESGVSYNVYGDPQGRERLWQLDLIPFLISSEEWLRIESGLTQRAELLNLILLDLYGPQDLLRRGLLPPEMVYGHPGFLRPCHPLRIRNHHALILYAADLARGPDGRMWVLSDRTQAPSGAGYALENRTVMAQVLPSLFRDSHVHRLAVFFQNMRAGLAAHAPRSRTEPRVVVLTPGPLNETYFEHAYLAGYLGYTLVQGDDLTVRDGRLCLRSMKRFEPVDVVMRRVDDGYCDPLELRPDSRLGVPGLVEAVRRGHLTVANPLGTSILENPALNAFLPGIAQYFLGQSLDLASVATWWCGEAKACEHVIAQLDRLVIRTIHRGAEAPLLFGSQLSRKQRDELAARIRAQPYRYVGQEQMHFSRVPTLVDQRLEARPAVLRTFLAARDDGYAVMPGGLTRVAPSADSLLVSNQAGGIAKDTWVLASEPEKQITLWGAQQQRGTVREQRLSLPAGAADNLFWFGRYAERAEYGIRLLRTVLAAHRTVSEFENADDRAALDALLQTLTPVTCTYPGFVGPEGAARRARPAAELKSLAVATIRSGSIAFNLHALLQAAYGVRDLLSVDTWRVVSDLRDRLEALTCGDGGDFNDLQSQLDQLVTALMALAGLAMESMLRGKAWVFLDMGRRMERALLLAALLRGTLVPARAAGVEATLLEAVLRCNESLMAYRRGYQGAPQIAYALDLVLLDENNPRALAFQLARLEKRAAALPKDGDGAGLSEEARLVLEAATALRLSDPAALVRINAAGALRGELDQLLVRVEHLLRNTSEVLSRGYFTDVRGPQQLESGGGPS